MKDTGSDGMSLRDYFAGQALSGMLANPSNGVKYQNGAPTVEDQVEVGKAMLRLMAIIAYASADAMLAACKEGGK